MGYDKTAMVAGPTNLLPAMLEDPDWVRDMYEVDTQLHIDMASEMMARGFQFDGAFVYDDMGYRNGTFFSHRVYRQLLWPSHKKICDFFSSQGLPVILHSCGNVNEFVPDLIEAGFACLQPLEVKAGMDLIHLKKTFGDRLAFMGGIDVRAMAAGGEWLEREVREKITCAMQGGGYIYHSDHSVPDNVSFANYCRTMELVKQYGSYGGA
jgi:uroporphyrinogen decarboxylase